MSKKTDSIYKCIKNLEKIEEQIKAIGEENSIPSLQDVDFSLKSELKTLTFWIDSLYKYNGKSTSAAKQNASAKNGCKGGRPPKAITEAKKRLEEINNSLIPSLMHSINMSNSNEEISKLDEEKLSLENEALECNKTIKEWTNKKLSH